MGPSKHEPPRGNPPEILSANGVRHKYQQYIFANAATLYEEQLVLVRGQRKYVWDAKGRQYLDAFVSILTVILGHGHPKVTEPLRDNSKRCRTRRRCIAPNRWRGWPSSFDHVAWAEDGRSEDVNRSRLSED